MTSPPSARRRRPLWTGVALLILVLIAATVPSPQGLLAQETTAIQRAVPRVSDPIPAPGSVVAPGPQLVAARVLGAEPSDVRFLVDGQPVSGRFADPDGQLSDRRGIQISLEPGLRTLGVAVEPHGVLREWPVLVTGLAVDHASADLTDLGIRTSGRRATPRPVLLVNPSEAATSMAAAPLAVATDALLLPTERSSLPAATLAAIERANLPADGQVLLLGGQDVIGEVVATALRDAGLTTTRVGSGDSASIIAAAATAIADGPGGDRPAAVVVAPDQPAAVALAAAVTAASTGSVLALVGSGALSPAIKATLGTAATALLADTLDPGQRAEVVAALPPDAAVSDDALVPRRAAEVMIVTGDVDAVDTPVALFAARGADRNRAVVLGTDAGRAYIAQHRPDRVTLVPGGATTDPAEDLAALLQQDWANTPDAPSVEVLVDPTAGLSITFTADVPVIRADVHVDLLGYEWPGTVTIDGDRAVWVADARPRLPEPLEPAAPGTAARIDVTARIEGGSGTRHIRAQAQAIVAPLTSLSREGFLVAGGSGDVVGRGPLRTFTIEIERATGLDLQSVADEAEAILLDPRGWTADGTRSLQRIGNSRAADLRVVVARPATVDLYCGRAGLSTGGRVSCWDGYRALLNLDRWNTGVIPFHTDLVVYRQYLVNHEFGHGLGYGHEFCPGPGAIAPVMQQQTGGIGNCQANGWPYPTIGDIVAVG